MENLNTQLNKYNSIGAIHIHSVYSDGTGKCYHSKYPGSGSNTFKWVIRDTSTLKIWNSLNMESVCTYNINLERS